MKPEEDLTFGDKIKNKTNVISKWVHRNRYLFVHILECVFILFILYCVLCECGVIGQGWNITSCEYYEKLQSWFQQTKYSYTITNSIIENVDESLNMAGEIVVETIGSSGQSLDVMNQIIMILLPLMVTLIALSFALLPKKIYGVRYANLRRLGINRAYSFLDMIIISIILFVSCIVFYYLDFVLCTILIDFLALVYIVLFLCFEIPLLSQSQRKINHIIKNSIDNEYVYQDEDKEKNNYNKQITDNFIYNEINDRGIYRVYFDCYKRTNRDSQKDANLVLKIYISKIEDEHPYVPTEEKRRLVLNFTKNCIEYFDILKKLNASFSDESLEYIDAESRLISKFIQGCVKFDDENDRQSFNDLFLALTTYDASPKHAKNLCSLPWLYCSTDLYKIAITNALLIYACCYENTAYLDLFANLYLLNIRNPITKRPDSRYFIFFTIYLFNFAENNDKSKNILNFQNELYKLSEYKETMREKLDFDGASNSHQCVMLLRFLLDFYKTLPSDVTSPFGFHDYINWKTMPPTLLRIGSFTPFTKIDICNWWITLILLLPLKDADELETNIKLILNDEDIKSLVDVYSKNWKNSEGNFKILSQYKSYFTALGIETSVTSDRQNQIQNVFNDLSNGETTSQTETSLKTPINTSSVDEKEVKTEIYRQIKNYVNEHAKGQEFYSSELPKLTFMKNYEVIFSKDNTTIDGFNSPHDAFWLLFDRDGYRNVHSQYLQKYTDKYFGKYKRSLNVKDISKYTKVANQDILNFKPDKKYAPRNMWARDKNDDGSQSSYQKILNIENTHTNLIQDTYLKNGAIKFYINCRYVSNYIVLDEVAIRVMLRSGEKKYKKTRDGKYIYRTPDLQGNFTEDELVDLLKGNIRRVTVTMEYGVTYDESKMLIYRIK